METIYTLSKNTQEFLEEDHPTRNDYLSLDVDRGSIISKLSSDNEFVLFSAFSTLSRLFYTIYENTDGNINFYNYFTNHYLALFIKKRLEDDVVIYDEFYDTLDYLPDGSLFVWCGEPMFIVGNNTYSITGNIFYQDFKFYENEPAYVIGKVNENMVEKIKSPH